MNLMRVSSRPLMSWTLKSLALAALAGFAGGCSQENLPEQNLVIENHAFTPTQISMAEGQKIRIRIENHDDTAEEFDSDSLVREKVVPGKSTGYVVVGPLKAGKYPFMGEYHSQTAQGAVVVQ